MIMLCAIIALLSFAPALLGFYASINPPITHIKKGAYYGAFILIGLSITALTWDIKQYF
jgi:hypothetical protein